MTWSIVARDETGAFGVAVASRFFAVGALCPHARSGVGALSTQALVNPLYARSGLDMLARGVEPSLVVEALTDPDDGRDQRQLHLVDSAGRVAAWTGATCIGWCGSLAGDGFSVAGNMLVGAAVLEQTAAAYQATTGSPLAERLIAALAAGEAAGGDKRGKQAAAIKVYDTEEYPRIDMRVDDHPEPIAELARLYQVSLERAQPFWSCLPSRAQPAGVTDRTVIEAEIERFRAARSARIAPSR